MEHGLPAFRSCARFSTYGWDAGAELGNHTFLSRLIFFQPRLWRNSKQEVIDGEKGDQKPPWQLRGRELKYFRYHLTCNFRSRISRRKKSRFQQFLVRQRLRLTRAPSRSTDSDYMFRGARLHLPSV